MTRVWDVVYIRALADLKAEAARAYIGILWWIAEPLLFMLCFYLLFGLGLRYGGENYVAFLLSGLIPYKWFSSTVSTGANAITANHALINMVYVPKYALVSSVLLANMVKFGFVLVLLLAFLATQGFTPKWAWLNLTTVVFVQLIIVAALSGISAAIIPFVPDFRLILDNGLLLLFFASGIFFDVATEAPDLEYYLAFNPLYCIIEGYRMVLLEGVQPNYARLAYSGLIGSGLLLLGAYLLVRLDRSFSRVTP